MKYVCPYCKQEKYSKNSKKSGFFTDWKSVRNHTAKCKYKTGEFYIDINYGPIHYLDFDKTFIRDNPLLKGKINNIKRAFNQRGIDFSIRRRWTKETILLSLKKYYLKYKKIPEAREFRFTNDYPSYSTVTYYFNTWNEAIKAAGLIPNTQNGYGIDTFGRDGHLYRSKAEAYFADMYLYGKYEYEIEPKYPKPYNKYYDWYIKELNLYIELDGNLRPEVIEEKIKINKLLGRKLIVVKTSDIYTKDLLDSNP